MCSEFLQKEIRNGCAIYFKQIPFFFDLFLGTNGANGANAGPTAEDGSCRNPAMCLGKNSINFTLLAYYRNTTVL